MRRLLGRVFLAMALVWSSATSVHALDPTRSIDQFHHTAWTLRDGMPGNIRAITQTADGFLWLGGDGGLFRFDGVRVERIDHFGPERLPSVSIESLYATPDGDLWIGFRDGAASVARVRQGQITTFAPEDGLGPGSVVQIAGGAAGDVWARISDSFREELAYFDGESWRRIETDFGIRAQDGLRGIWDFAFARDGTAWVKNGLGLYYLRAGAPRFESAPGYGGRTIGFARAGDGRLWTADQNTQRFYALPDFSTQTRTIAPPVLSAAVPETFRGIIIIDRDETVWCANLREGGVSRIRSPATEAAPVSDRYMADDGLTSDQTFAIFEDREGNIWVGTAAGLDRFRAADIVQEPRVTLTGIGPLLHAMPDALYVYSGFARIAPNATEGTASIYRIGSDGIPRRVAINVGDMLTMAPVRRNATDLAYVSRDPVGSSFTRYLLRDGHEPMPIPFAATGSSFHEMRTYWTDDDATVYSRGGVGYFRFDNGVETQLIAKETQETHRLALNWRGRHWVYYSDGTLYEVQGDRAREHRAPVRDPVHAVETDEQRMLFGGQMGLLNWDGREFRALSATRFPQLSAIVALRLPGDGAVWIATQQGLLRTTTADLDRALADPNAPLAYRLFDFQDGLAGAINADSYGGQMSLGPDGRVWFATAEGLNWIDPNRLAHNALPPPVVVTALMALGQTYEMPADVRLPPGSSSLQVDYTALSLTIPERNRFRYRLEGVDDDWVDAGDRRQAFYTRLEPGTYRFRVIAANNDGVWNDGGATLAFTIAPTFLQSIWFKFLIALALVALAVLVYTWRLRQEEARLQGRFEVRIAERERIARELHDTLLQGFQGLMLRFQSIVNRVPEGGELRTSLDDALDRADAVLVEGRARVRELRAKDAEGDLAKAIVDCAHRAIEGDTPDFRLTVEGSPRVLHGLVNEELPRIAEEAIRNAVQHARAQAIEVVLSYGRAELRLVIRDDGVGMPASIVSSGERSGHYGLVGMRERAERIEARLDVASREGAGAEIALSVPAQAAYKDKRVGLLTWLWPVRARS